MVCIDVWRLAMAALYVMVVATNSAMDVPAQQRGGLAGEDGPAALEAPAGDQATHDKKDEKRNDHYCMVDGHKFQHNEVFSYPGYTHCIKYRCDNGGYSIVQSACERNSQCVQLGSVISDKCRSLRCMREKIGSSMYSYQMKPTIQDKCDTGERCVAKNWTFQHSDCSKYQCVPTAGGGYYFHRMVVQCRFEGRCVPINGTVQHSHCNKYQCISRNNGYYLQLIAFQCRDYDGRCFDVGEIFRKVIGGNEYKCVCNGDSYTCSHLPDV